MLENQQTDCMVVDPEFWNETTSKTITSEQDCRKACLEEDQKWNWMVFVNTTCYCMDHITTGNISLFILIMYLYGSNHLDISSVSKLVTTI
jgi:hypothetical protein